MIALDDFETVKRKVDALRRKRDESIGALKQLKLRLKKEFDCDTIAEAKELLAKLTQEEIELASQWAKQLAAFKKKWKHMLEEVD